MSEGNVRGYESQHLRDRSVHLQEDTVVELLQAEQLEDLSRFGSHLIDTDEASYEEELRFWFNKEVSAGTSLSSKTDEVRLTSMIFLQVLDRAVLELTTLVRVGLKMSIVNHRCG